jgi:MFS transporter, FHS family, glucose/mannose:H+ symporter
VKRAAAGSIPVDTERERRASAELVPLLFLQAVELLTGIGLTLLGSMLPQLSGYWRLNDAHCGALLLAVFTGSSLGALLVRAPFYRSLMAGLLLMACGMAGLNPLHGRLVYALLLLFGLGLGLTMTSNSMLIGERFPRRRAAMLTVLNFSWSAGAALCPFAVRGLLRHGGVPTVFWAIAAAAALGMALSFGLLRGNAATHRSQAPPVLQRPARIVAFFAIFILLYCGVEASIGGWVLTYVHRMGLHVAAAPPLVTSCFWLSVLAGRALAPAILLRVREERLLAVAVAGAFAGVVLLLAARPLGSVLLAAALAGFCLAPIFPICVSILMSLSRDAAQARWLFAIAGMGSASLPWLTGLAAQRSGSLHVGLLVPLAALVIMLVMVGWPSGGVQLFRSVFPPPGDTAEHEPLASRPLPST